jgi:hypothetical protein
MTVTTRAKRGRSLVDPQDTLPPIGVEPAAVDKSSTIIKESPKVILDARLLRVMTWVYKNYTGHDVARVIAHIRQQIEHNEIPFNTNKS